MRRKTGEELRSALEAKRAFYRECVVEVPGWMPEVVGIFIGGCVARGVGSSFRAQAHAHNSRVLKTRFDINTGWICIRSIARLGKYHAVAQGDGSTLIVIDKASRLLMHEYAHILCEGHGHDDKWRKTMKRLGQPLPAQYQKGIAEWNDKWEL
jgi:hypothetical protein